MTPVAAAAAAATIAALVAGSPAQDAPAPAATASATSDRGIAGAVEIVTDGSPLRARPEQTLDAPLLVRVARSEAGPDGRVRSRIEFIGTIVGEFDLRPLLEHVDGSPADAIPPIIVRIESTLPGDVGSDLYGGTSTERLHRTWYYAALAVGGIAWISVPVIVAVRRRLRRVPVAPPPPPAPTPSLADRLRPLVRSAIDGSLGVAGLGQLELLLYGHWRQRLGLEGLSQAQAVATLRRHPEAGRLLVAVERWLHDRGSAAGRPPDDEVESLLAPYREVPATGAALGVAGAAAGGGVQ